MILIVSWPEDDHAGAVRRELARLGLEATVLDLSRFPQRLRLAVEYQGRRRRYHVTDGETDLDLQRFRVVWWRRPQQFALHPEIAEGPHATFAYTEASEAFGGMWQCLDATWINHPARDEAAGRKVYQLRVAQAVGLDIPETLITNDAERARRFVDARGAARVAYKSFLPSAVEWRETRILRPEEVEQMEAVRYAPVIFQEYVPPAVDLRITVVGHDIFATAIHSAEAAYQADYRMDLGTVRVEPFALPDEVRSRLRRLMGQLDLVYGAIDMRLDPDGRYVFFEVNPAGQWLFVEERTGQPITPAFARLLAAHADRRPGTVPAPHHDGASAPVRVAPGEA